MPFSFSLRCCLALLFTALPLFAKDAPVANDPLKATTREAGFFDLYRDLESGRLLIGVHELDAPFLLITSLPGGLGSNDVGLDRGQSGTTHLVRFQRVGDRLLLVAQNTRFVANSTDAAERLAAVDAFAPAVLWAGKILARPKDRSLVIDIAPYLAADRHGVADALKAAAQGDYAIDAERSVALAKDARTFPDNTELESLLTFSGPGEAEFVREVAADPKSLTLRQHISFVRLPPPGFQPRAFHPASGGFSSGVIDFAQPLTGAIDVRWQPRFRLEKQDPNAAVSTPKKAIVFYLDRGTPEPIRSALLDGARWWGSAFEQAGFRDAFRVELLPEGVDPMDVRYSIITWTHRATRGWSYGQAIVDPRSGEIIKGSVNLGSQRVRQDILIAEALLAPYDKADATARAAEAHAMALARLRQLAAHEVGHSLGFAHNFAASRTGTGSVMDYPHPLIELDASGAPRLANAYGVGVGAWDVFLVRHAYGVYRDELGELARLRQEIRKAGFEYVSDPDARAAGDAHPQGALWDMAGSDTLGDFDRVLRARQHALAHFSVGVLPPDRQLGELEARLVPIYLLHRYQLEAVARLLGGARYAYGLAGEADPGTFAVDAKTQLAARQRLLLGLRAQTLALPAGVLSAMTPPAYDYARNREYFATRATPLFDPLAAADAAAALTLQLLLAPPRLQRLALQHARDPALPGVRDTIEELLAASWRQPIPADAGLAQVQRSVNWVVLDALLALLDGGELHASVDAELRAQLRSLAVWANGRGDIDADLVAAADRIARYLADPASVKLRALPTIPPGAPI